MRSLVLAGLAVTGLFAGGCASTGARANPAWCGRTAAAEVAGTTKLTSADVATAAVARPDGERFDPAVRTWGAPDDDDDDYGF